MQHDDVTTNLIWRTATILNILFWLYHRDLLFHPPPLRLESRKPLWRDLQMPQVGGGKTGNRLRWSIHFSGRRHNSTLRFWSSPTSVITAVFSDRPGPL